MIFSYRYKGKAASRFLSSACSYHGQSKILVYTLRGLSKWRLIFCDDGFESTDSLVLSASLRLLFQFLPSLVLHVALVTASLLLWGRLKELVEVIFASINEANRLMILLILRVAKGIRVLIPIILPNRMVLLHLDQLRKLRSCLLLRHAERHLPN